MKSLIQAMNKEFFIESFFSGEKVSISGENPVYVNIEFKDGRAFIYNASLTGEIGKILEISHMHLLPVNTWGVNDKYLFERVMKKNEKIAKRLHQDYIFIEPFDKHVEGWLEEMGYEVKGKNKNYLGTKRLK
jgi:hypothetical protein